jgi:hypothetical protein
MRTTLASSTSSKGRYKLYWYCILLVCGIFFLFNIIHLPGTTNNKQQSYTTTTVPVENHYQQQQEQVQQQQQQIPPQTTTEEEQEQHEQKQQQHQTTDPPFSLDLFTKHERCAKFMSDQICFDIYPYAFNLQKNQEVIENNDLMRATRCNEQNVCLDFISQLSTDRLFRIKSMITTEIPLMLRKLPNPRRASIALSVAFYTQDVVSDWNKVYREIYNDRNICKGNWCNDHLNIHMVYREDFFPYPINLLRNVGFLYSTGNWLFMYDIDFVASSNLAREMYLVSELSEIDELMQSMYVVPVFEFNDNKIESECTDEVAEEYSVSCNYGIPEEKEDLIHLWNQNLIEPFHFSYWKQGQRATDYNRWKTIADTEISYPADTYENGYEPYVIFHRNQLLEDAPDGKLCDERFFNRNFNKVICYDRLRLRGLIPIVISQPFLLHFFEARKKQSNSMHLPPMMNGDNLYNSALKFLERKYNKNPS